MFDLPSSIDVRPMVEWEEERICSDGGLEERNRAWRVCDE